MKRFLLPAFALLAVPAHADKIDDLIADEMKRQNIPGLTLGIVRNGKLERTSSYGFADAERKAAATNDDVYEIGSITKQFTAFATMLLADEGKLSIDDPVSKYIPESPEKWKDIKLRHLLYQTSGLMDYVFLPGLGIVDDFDRAKFMKEVPEQPLDFPTGTTWAYSNTNYALLGWVIEKAAGMPYDRFVTERILKPLGMTETVFIDPWSLVPNRSKGHMWMQGQLLRAKLSGGGVNSDGTLASTVKDMAKWDSALRERKLLKPASYEAIWSPAKLNSGRMRPYGMGWFLTSPKSPEYVGHAGNSSGYSAGFSRYEKARITVIVLSNVYPAGGEQIAKSVAETLEPSLRPEIPKEMADPDTARTERVKTALAALADGKADDSLLEAEVTAPMKSSRARMNPGFRPLKQIQRMAFAGSQPHGPDTLLSYRIFTPDRAFTAHLGWSKEGKLSQLVLRPDPK